MKYTTEKLGSAAYYKTQVMFAVRYLYYADEADNKKDTEFWLESVLFWSEHLTDAQEKERKQ